MFTEYIDRGPTLERYNKYAFLQMYGNSLECKFINYLCNFALSNHGVPTFSNCIFLLVFKMNIQKESTKILYPSTQ